MAKKKDFDNLNLEGNESFKEKDRKSGGRPKKSDNEKCDKRLLLYFTQQELDMLKEKAKKLGLTIGRYAKLIIMQELNK